VSPILVRPVREQLEHDRIIRLLQAKFKRKFDVGINPGVEQNAAVAVPSGSMYPDVVLQSPDRGRKLQAVIEVETGESVNHLEALAEWGHFSKARAAFHLYVPAGMVDVARRLCEDNQIYVAEIWSYHTVGDQVRFTMVFRNKETPPKLAPLPKLKPVAPPKPVAPKPPAKPAPKKKPAAKPAKKAKIVKKAKRR